MKSKNMNLRGYGRQDHRSRNDLAQEHPFGDMGQLILAATFLIIWTVDSFIGRWTVFLQLYVPLYISIPLGVLIAAAACYLGGEAHHIVFKQVRETPVVIEKSVYKLVRHPLYLGSLLLYLAFIAATLSLASLAFWIIVLFFYNFIAAYEEKMLEKKYSDEYQAYKGRVARWIPGIW